MEDAKRNDVPDSISKRDKKRQQVGVRLNKLEVMFRNDRDSFYRSSLHELQTKLAMLQQGTNEELVAKKIRLEEQRDYELTKLRLWEEYRVKRIESEYNEDLSNAKDNHDKMIKLIKEKLYDKLQNQIKQLKEDKLLLNLVNGNSWSNSPNQNASTAAALSAAAAAAGSLSLNDRRSLRKRELSSRFTAGEADDLSDGGLGAGSTTGNASSIPAGYVSATGKRRRLYATRYSSNEELSSGITSNGAAGQPPGSSYRNGNSVAASSGYDSNLSDKDYDALNSLIMHNDDCGASLVLLDKNSSNSNNNSNKPNTRGSHKQFVGVQGLKPEELNEDLSLLRNAIVKKEK